MYKFQVGRDGDKTIRSNKTLSHARSHPTSHTVSTMCDGEPFPTTQANSTCIVLMLCFVHPARFDNVLCFLPFSACILYQKQSLAIFSIPRSLVDLTPLLMSPQGSPVTSLLHKLSSGRVSQTNRHQANNNCPECMRSYFVSLWCNTCSPNN